MGYDMSIEFGSPEANEILAADELVEKVRAISGTRLKVIEKELQDINDEIAFFDMSIQDLKNTRRALLREKKRLESGQPG